MAAAAKVRRIANCILTDFDMSAGDGQIITIIEEVGEKFERLAVI